MLTPEEFIERWRGTGESDDPLNRFSVESIITLGIPDDCKRFLIEAGLPDSCAPFLSFYAPVSESAPEIPPHGLRTVAERWKLPEPFMRYREIGANGSGDSIAIDEKDGGSVVYLNHDYAFARVPMNASVCQLAESLLAYRKMIEEATTINGDCALIENNVPASCRFDLERELRRIDSSAMAPGSFWAQEIADLAEIADKRPTTITQPRRLAGWLRNVAASLRRRVKHNSRDQTNGS